jgi:YD repeat-containing protein
MSGDTALPTTDHHAFTRYTYDAKRRISQAAVYTINYGVITGPQTYTFNYNSSGNRTGPVYDDKLNLNRTNKIWMFLARDYSMNNPFVATQYNLNDLPLVIPSATLQIVPGASGKIKVAYACP